MSSIARIDRTCTRPPIETSVTTDSTWLDSVVVVDVSRDVAVLEPAEIATGVPARIDTAPAEVAALLPSPPAAAVDVDGVATRGPDPTGCWSAGACANARRG